MANLKAEKREGKGKYNAFEMRKTGKIPAVVYGKSMKENLNISIVLKEFLQLLKAGERLIDLNIDGKTSNVLLVAAQHGTYDHEILHADFRAISANEVIEVVVDIELEGAEEAPGVKAGGMLEQNMHQVSARCLPKNLPEKVIVDVSGMEIGAVLYGEDLPKLEGVEYVFHGNPAVVSCQQPTAAEEEDEAAEGEESTSPEVIGEKEREEKSKE